MNCRDCKESNTYLYEHRGLYYCRDDFMARFGYDPVESQTPPKNRGTF